MSKTTQEFITFDGDKYTKKQLINRILSYEEKLNKTQLSEYRKKLNNNNCKSLLNMLIPPTKQKQCKTRGIQKPKQMSGNKGKKPIPAQKPTQKPPVNGLATKSAHKSKTIAGVALEQFPLSIAKQIVQLEIFKKWASANGSKCVKPVPNKESESESESSEDSDSDDSDDSDLEDCSDSE
jgi:hypothetical protein